VAARSIPVQQSLRLQLKTAHSGMRALAWDGNLLYASRGYTLFSAQINSGPVLWIEIASYTPAWWRTLTSRNRLAFRLLRDGFHALAISQGNLVAALPGAMATLSPGLRQFQVTHRLLRGTRPLHLAPVPDGRIFWGEYFDNPARDKVHIYASPDAGLTWNIVYTFPQNSIRHIHNILYDRWADCLWIFTGDYGSECRILRASLDFRTLENVVCGNQQARAVAALAAEEGLYFASDTPLEQNHIYFLDRRDLVRPLVSIPSSSLHACSNAVGFFFSTMVEPSFENPTRDVALFGSRQGSGWRQLGSWRKDPWPMKYFQYGNLCLPGGLNSTAFLAASSIAVQDADLQTFIWEVHAQNAAT
jgi:hypothetical protein